MNDQRLILVTGATGNTGSELVKYLSDHQAKIRVASRSSQPALEHQALITNVQFNWFEHSTYEQTLKGIHSMYLVPPPGILNPEPVMMPFLKMAAQAGVQRVVLLSAAVIERGGYGLGAIHDALPRLFKEWTVLRPSWFMQNFIGQHSHAHSIQKENVIFSATGNGRIGFIDARDIAYTAAHALLSESSLNRDLLLTGPETLSYEDIAKIISSVRVPAVQHQNVSVEELQQIHINAGLPAEFAQLLSQADLLIAGGREDRVTEEVEAVTGTAPSTFKDFATRHWDGLNHFKS